MIIGTTPTHVFELPFPTDFITKLHIIYSQDDSVILTKTEEDCTITEDAIEVTLTQEESFLFDKTKVMEIQVRILTSTGTALGSIPIKVRPVKCLESGVLI